MWTRRTKSTASPFQGVGSATTVEYVQVHNNLDDGVEFFGGTVDARYVVLTGNADDSLDWTDGWTGRIQYLYIEQTDAADNAIEADNREGDEGAMPRSNPTIANMTVRGKSDENALRLRRGTGLALRNSFVDGAATCIRVDGSSRDLLGTELTIEGVSFACAETHKNDDGAVASYVASAIEVSANGERVAPVALGDAFFDPVDFVGAFGAGDWSAGWTYPGSVASAAQPDFGCPDGTSRSTRTLNGKRVCELSGTITQDLVLTSDNVYALQGKVVIGGDNEASAYADRPGRHHDLRRHGRGLPRDLARFADRRERHAHRADHADQPVRPRGRGGPRDDAGRVGRARHQRQRADQRLPRRGQRRHGGLHEGGRGQRRPLRRRGPERLEREAALRGRQVRRCQCGSRKPTQRHRLPGVGAGTEVDYVQVHNNLDDGIEFFGGTVNAKHVVLTGNADDALDWTDGWQGSIQYLVIDQAGDAGDNGIEADNREGDENATPRSQPKIANMTSAAIPASGRSGCAEAPGSSSTTPWCGTARDASASKASR